MTLRRLLVNAACVLLGVVLLLSLTPAAPARSGSATGPSVASKKRPPNILIILTDDQRDTPLWDMPATRRYFQREGVDFSNAFATTPLCCPSRSSIFSGRYVHNHGVETNRLGSRLDLSTTMQRYLRAGGYRTALVGKYLNNWGTSKPPKHWDRWAYFLPRATKYRGATFNVDGRLVMAKGHSTRFIAKRSVKLLKDFERDDDTPWFMYVAPKAPHKPFVPAPGDWKAKVHGFEGNPAVHEDAMEDKPPWIRNCKDLCGGLRTGARSAVGQQRTLLSVDDLVRDVLKQMTALGEDRRTLAFFISDNGYMWGEHGKVGKGQPYEHSVRVPFFARWPGHLRPGSVDDRLMANIDIAPTVLDATGIEPDVPMDGRSVLDPTAREFLLLESLHGKAGGVLWSSIRTPTERYTEYQYPNNGVMFREHYDLAQDPWELDNLMVLNRTVSGDQHVEDLAALLAAARTCAGATCP